MTDHAHETAYYGGDNKAAVSVVSQFFPITSPT